MVSHRNKHFHISHLSVWEDDVNKHQAVQLHPHNKQANACHLDLELSDETDENGFLKLLI